MLGVFFLLKQWALHLRKLHLRKGRHDMALPLVVSSFPSAFVSCTLLCLLSMYLFTWACVCTNAFVRILMWSPEGPPLVLFLIF